MKYQIAIGVAMAITLLTSIAIANGNVNAPVQDMQTHHQGNGMMGMMNMQNMMNGDLNWEEMHEQCESTMGEEAHEQCEAMMESNDCPMMG